MTTARHNVRRVPVIYGIASSHIAGSVPLGPYASCAVRELIAPGQAAYLYSLITPSSIRV